MHGMHEVAPGLSLLLSRPVSFHQTNSNKHLRIHHHLRVLVYYRGYIKLYFTYLLNYLLYAGASTNQ